jgi:hypothetical protein
LKNLSRGPSNLNPNRWQEYIISLICQIILPLLPLLFESFLRAIFLDKATPSLITLSGAVTEDSTMLTAAIYPITIGVSSRQRLTLVMSILASMFYAVFYGALVVYEHPVPPAKEIAFLGIIIVSITHAVERFFRHILKEERYLNF